MEPRTVLLGEPTSDAPSLAFGVDRHNVVMLLEFELQLVGMVDDDVHGLLVPGLDLHVSPIGVEYESTTGGSLEGPLHGLGHGHGRHERDHDGACALRYCMPH